MRSFLIIAVTLALPLVFLKSTIDPVLPLRFLLLALILLAYQAAALVSISTGRQPGLLPVLPKAVFIVAGIYLLVTAIAVFPATNHAEAIYDLLRSLLLIALLVSACQTLAGSASRRILLNRSVTVSALIMATIGLSQYYDIAFMGIPGNVAPYGTMANKNLLASLLCLSLPFALYSALGPSRPWSGIATVATVLSLLTVIVSQTRSALVALVIAAVVSLAAVAWWLKGRRNRWQELRRYQRRLILLTLTVLVTAAVAGSGIISRPETPTLARRVVSVTDFGDASIKERLVLWDNSIAIFREHPLTGVGPGNWKLHFPAYGTDGTRAARGDIFYQRPHNDYLWVLTETGIFGLLFYLLFFAGVIWYGLRLIGRTDSGDDVAFAILMLFGVIAFLTVAFFSYPRERIAHLALLTFTLAGIIVGYSSTLGVGAKLNRRKSAVVAAIMLVICLTATVVGFVRLRGDSYAMNAQKARARGQWQQVIEAVDRGRSTLYTLDPTSTPLLWYRGVAQFALGHQDLAFADFSRALKDNPNHPHVLNNLATCYELRGQHGIAIEHYRRALNLASGFDDAYLNLAAVYYNLGQYQEAAAALQGVSAGCADSRYQHFRNKIDEKLNRPDSLNISTQSSDAD